MARKKKHPEHVNHERWLVSYADFITLLFAFFVVMFAVSQVDSKKVGRFTESFSKAIGIDMFPQPGKGLLGGATDPTLSEQEIPKGSALPEELVALKVALTTMQSAQKPEGLQVLKRRNELVLRLSDSLLFESGNDALEERARRVVSYLAGELKNRKVDIRVEGHTDNRPIRTARYRSNWDLSTARATTIVARLAAEGIAPPRLSAAGYGEFHPIAPNDTEEGRKQNRRVDLVVTVHAEPEPTELVKPDEEKKEGRKKAEADEAKKHEDDDEAASESPKKHGDEPAKKHGDEPAKKHGDEPAKKPGDEPAKKHGGEPAKKHDE